MVGVEQIVFRDKLDQLALDFQHIFAWGDIGAIGDTKDMGIDGHGELAKRRVQHHVGSFASDPWQRFEGFAVVRNLAAVFLDQDAAGLEHVLRLARIQADGLDVAAQAVVAKRVNRFRGVGDRIQLGRGLVDADVGGLAERITAISSSKGVLYASSVLGSGLSS